MIATDDYAKARRMAAAVIRTECEPPERLTVTEWADKYRILPRSSTAPGPFRSSVAPYTRRWMDLGADPTVTRMVLCWASQTLKSTVIENIMGHKIDLMPGPMIFVRPTQPDAEMWSKERFRTMVRVTPRLSRRVMLNRSSESTIRFMKFRGDVGFLSVASSQSPSELASWSTEWAGGDEVDRMYDVPGEGPPMDVIEKRTGAAEVFKIIETSTPGDLDTSRIWPGLLAGTHEKLYVPCPHCGEFQTLEWRRETKPDEAEQFNLHIPHGKPYEATYICLNGCVIQPDAKDELLQQGEWRATNPEGTYPSSHLNALYSPFAGTSWGRIAEEWEKIGGKPEPLRVFVNTRLAEPFSDRMVTKVAHGDLLGRRVQWGETVDDIVVPDGVGVLTVGVDVQGNRIEGRVWGWGMGLESWLIDRFVLVGDPARELDSADSIWGELTTALAKEYHHVSGQVMPIKAGLMDSGHVATQVYKYCDPRRRKPFRLFYACKGDEDEAGEKRPMLSKPTLKTTKRVPLYIVGVDGAKRDFLLSQIYEVKPGPGYVHWPLWASEEELQGHLSEELKRVTKRTQRGIETKKLWVPKKMEHGKGEIPNEPLDCRNYARAALELVPKYAERMESWVAELSVTVGGDVESVSDATTAEADDLSHNPTLRDSGEPRSNFLSDWMR